MSSHRTLRINITGDTGQLVAFMERHVTWPKWRRWLWRHGIGW